MKIIEPSFEIMYMPSPTNILLVLERAARVCYKSEDKTKPESANTIIHGLIKSGHESVIEHMGVTVKFTCDRGISHELVRHRIASFSQESTRYANYSKEKFGNEITVIRPIFWPAGHMLYTLWRQSCKVAETSYLTLLKRGATAQEARSVLPNSLKTEVVTTANLREWRHILRLRCSKASHPQIRQIMLPLLDELNSQLPVLFEQLYEKYHADILKLTNTGLL